MEKKAFVIHLSGMVQGVGFRHFAYKKANAYDGITGYVKNLSDGRVKIYAEGPESQLKNFLSEIEEGPSFASVDDTELDWVEAENKYDRFFIESSYGF